MKEIKLVKASITPTLNKSLVKFLRANTSERYTWAPDEASYAARSANVDDIRRRLEDFGIVRTVERTSVINLERRK